jgi:hypothetical protein
VNASDCSGCVHYYYEADTNWKECRHPEFDENKPDTCPGCYSKEDAKADAHEWREDR